VTPYRRNRAWVGPRQNALESSSSQTVRVPEDCIFCLIVKGDAASYVVAEDDRTVAFLDRGQATEGHTLVVPRMHARDIWSISEVDASSVMAMA